MFAIFSTLFICLILNLLLFFYKRYSYWRMRGILYETPIPPFGNFTGIGQSKHLSQIINNLYRKFKGKAKFCGVYMFVSKAALIIDLDLIKSVLIKDFYNFQDRHAFHNVEEDPLTGHLVNLEGEEWRAMRTKLSPVFTSAKMKYMFSTMVEVSERLSETFKRELEECKEQVLEIKDLCARYTTDIIGSCAFGIECNSLKDPNSEFAIKGRTIFTEARHSLPVQIFMVTCPEWAKKLNMKFFTDEISDFFINLVRQTVDYRLTNNIKRNDFMDLLIELMNKSELGKRTGIDLSLDLTIEQMAAQTFVFFLGGFETSSTTMSFCLYELAKHQVIQQQLREEILTTIEENNNEISYESVNSMHYLEKVIAETLRLYPVLPNLVRNTNSDYPVPNSHHIIEKGTSIVIPISAIHRDSEYYEDPEKFDPERFDPESIAKRHGCAYLPFGMGPRSCIGARFGKMQIKLGLIVLLKNYRFECCSQTEMPIVLDKKNFLIAPKNGIYLKVIPL